MGWLVIIKSRIDYGVMVKVRHDAWFVLGNINQEKNGFFIVKWNSIQNYLIKLLLMVYTFLVLDHLKLGLRTHYYRIKIIFYLFVRSHVALMSWDILAFFNEIVLIYKIVFFYFYIDFYIDFYIFNIVFRIRRTYLYFPKIRFK